MANYGYESERYPLLKAIVHESQEHHLTPADAYLRYFSTEQQIGDYPPVYFVSTAFRSGGYFRDPELDLTNPTAVQRAERNNLKVAGLLLKQIAKDNNNSIHRNYIVVPTELDGMQGWVRTDYMQFWGYVLGGISPAAAREIDSEFEADKDDLLRTTQEFENGIGIRKEPSAYSLFIERLNTAIAENVNESERGITSILELVDKYGSLEGLYGNYAAFQLRKTTVRPLLRPELLGEDSELAQKLGELAAWRVKMDERQTATTLRV